MCDAVCHDSAPQSIGDVLLPDNIAELDGPPLPVEDCAHGVRFNDKARMCYMPDR